MDKKICCVNDMPGVGKIALAAIMPILSSKGISVSTLPTALVSNTLDFGKFEILDTSDYMEKTVDVWNELGFQFDCIATGFMVNPRQVDIIQNLIDNQNKEQVLVVVDPIMGDEGKLYNGVTEENVKIMRKLSSLSDVLIPNFTEACFLTNTFYENPSLTIKQAEALIKKCCELGAKSVVITSANVLNHDCVVGYDHNKDDFFIINFNMIDIRFPGTGDIFSGVLISDLLNDEPLQKASLHAMNVISDLIKENMNKKEKFYGVDIEKYLVNKKL